MPRRALIEKRPWLVASIGAAAAYYALRLSTVPELYLIPVKGAACALLALYAMLQGTGSERRWLAGMMAIAALGDMVIEIDVGSGALLFFTYHIVAISLYLRHPREHATPTQKAAAVAMLLLTPLLAWLLPADRAMAWQTALYGLALGGMAACAWMSAFPRYRVGVGAALFVASDLLLIAGRGPLMGGPLPEMLVWPLYYLGQFLIAVGVVQVLRRRGQAASRAA
jgi:uncharacterized membrane protein YhhN